MIVLILPIHPWQATSTLSAHDTDNSLDSDTDSDSDTPHTFILDRLMNPPTTWEHELWHRITCHSRHNTLNQSLLSGKPVITCSDASVDTASFSTFSWIIYCQKALWQGEGIVPGLVDDVYSGRSEAFGILTTLRFLGNYLMQYPNTYPTRPKFTIYCDNQGVLDRIHKLLEMEPIHSRTTTTDDYDIYAAIRAAVKDIKVISVRFVHIKGHQDKGNTRKQLSLPAQLNIECDHRATDYLAIA